MKNMSDIRIGIKILRLSKIHDLSRIRMYGNCTTQLDLLLTIGITVRWLMWTFITKIFQRKENYYEIDFEFIQTFLVLFQLNDTVHEMQLNEHNKPVLVLILNVYIWHMYDKVDMLMLEVRQMKSYYHPKEHDNVMVEMYLEYQHVNINKNRIQLDVLSLHRL